MQLPVLAADQRRRQPVRVVDEVEGEAALDAEVAVVRDVRRVGRDLDDPLRLRVDVQVDLAADAAERARRLRLDEARPRGRPARPRRTSRRSRRSGRPTGSRRRARTRCRATTCPRSGRCAPRRRGPRARARSTASPPACTARSARRGCRRPGRSPSAGRGPRTARASRPAGRSAPRPRGRSASSSSSFGRPAGFAFRCSVRSISVSVRWNCGTDEFVEIDHPLRDACCARRQRPRRALDADDAHPAAAVRVELVVVAERRDEDVVAARARGRAARPRAR